MSTISTAQSLTDEANELIDKYHFLQNNENSSEEEIEENLEALADIFPYLRNYHIETQAVLAKLMSGDR